MNFLRVNLKPSETLSPKEVNRGMKLVINDGLATEAMTTLTSGAFLVAFALKLGASNFQIGLLASLPTFTNILQLVSIWLVQKYNNRRAVAVTSNFLARFPLLALGLFPFVFTTGTSIGILISLLFFHYFFGSVAGPSWNSWMKDLIPQKQLGNYFSRRSRLTQTLNVTFSVILALSIDYLKVKYPGHDTFIYAIMFLTGGTFGMISVYFLARTPEPQSVLPKENIFKLLMKPLKDTNFRRLLLFQSFWSFALNLATPFFSVYMMKVLKLPLSSVIFFGILSQLSSIVFIKMWGRYTDRFSNKTIIHIAAPLYICCILSWSFVGLASTKAMVVLLVALLNIISGMATAGINLAIGNIGIKLASKDEAIVYFSARSVVVALISFTGPMLGGFLADFFAKRSLSWSFEWNGPQGKTIFPLLNLHGWNFLFIVGGVLAFLSTYLLKKVKEEGEVEKRLAVAEMRVVFRKNVKNRMTKKAFLSLLVSPVVYPLTLKKRIERKVIMMRRHNKDVGMKTA